jgi:predicted alpha/beta-fold hydrolase
VKLERIVARMVPDGFSSPRWLRSAHLQTLGAALPLWAPPRSFRPGRQEALRITLPREGALHAVAWWQEGSKPRPAAILVHGVGGSSASRYVVRAAVAFAEAGWHAIRLDLRGAGESMPDAPELYHAGLTEDPRVALDAIAADPRVSGVAMVGFSLGGHVALRLAGELGDRVPAALRAVVSISAPLDLVQVAHAMERPRSLPYRRYVLGQLVRQGTEFARLRPLRAPYEARALRGLRTIRAYDEVVVAPMHGFASAFDYYTRVSAGPMLGRIVVPTLVVHADDDPMVPGPSVRAWLGGASRAVEQAWSATGGHVGWFAGVRQTSWVRTWAVDLAIDFVERHAPA